MKAGNDKGQRRKIARDYLLVGGALVFSIFIISVSPERTEAVATVSWSYFWEMIMILPAVMVLLGLFNVWISKEAVVKYLGRASGIKGLFIAVLIGALPTGPLYVAFPMAAALIKKGASTANIVVFLSAWACIKIPQELVELQFLGLEFMVVRLVLTIAFVAIMGLSIERIIEWSDKKSPREDVRSQDKMGVRL